MLGAVMEKRKKINPREIKKSYMEKIEDSLAKQGVTFYSPENGTLNINSDLLPLPRDLTEEPSKTLGEYLNVLTQQKLYYRTLLGRLESCLEESKRKYIESTKGLYHEYSLAKISETAKDRLINADEDVIPFYEKYADDKRRVDLMNYSIANIEDAIFLVSREMTRRLGDFNSENRSHNAGRR